MGGTSSDDRREQNKALVRYFYEEVATKGRLDLLEAFAAPDMVDHAGPLMGWPSGREGFLEHLRWLHREVTAPRVEVNDLLAEDDRVVAFWTLSGVHTGTFLGVPATGKPFEVAAISVLTFADGRLIEYKVKPDTAGFIQHVKASPPR